MLTESSVEVTGKEMSVIRESEMSQGENSLSKFENGENPRASQTEGIFVETLNMQHKEFLISSKPALEFVRDATYEIAEVIGRMDSNGNNDNCLNFELRVFEEPRILNGHGDLHSVRDTKDTEIEEDGSNEIPRTNLNDDDIKEAVRKEVEDNEECGAFSADVNDDAGALLDGKFLSRGLVDSEIFDDRDFDREHLDSSRDTVGKIHSRDSDDVDGIQEHVSNQYIPTQDNGSTQVPECNDSVDKTLDTENGLKPSANIGEGFQLSDDFRTHTSQEGEFKPLGENSQIFHPCLQEMNDGSDSTKMSDNQDWQELETEYTRDAQENGSVISVGTEEMGRDEEQRQHLGRENGHMTQNRSLPKDFVSTGEREYATSSECVSDPRNHPESGFNKNNSLPSHPAGLGAPLLEPSSRPPQQLRMNGTPSTQRPQQVKEHVNGEHEESDETREKLQMIRVKFLRLAHRLGQTPHNVVVAQVLYRLGLAEQLRGGRHTSRAGAFSFDRASAMAEQLESAGQEPLDFSCTILVLGKTGVGKSATINSIYDRAIFETDASQVSTKKVQAVEAMVQGIRVRVIDTPGLLSSATDQCQNEKILYSVKRFIKKTPPDIVLYLDRLDMQNRDYGDVLLLRTISNIFGLSIWFNTIVVLTHAASAPPDGPNGTLSYEMFVTQRSHVVQQAIRLAAGDVRLMNPVSLVENHSACRMNRAGQRVLPNGQVWKPQLLLLSFASKILTEANTLLKLQDDPPDKSFGARPRVPPLPFLLSSLLQSRPQLKLPEDQFCDEDDMGLDLEESSDSDTEAEYDELPPFKCLTKTELANLSKEERKAYFDELEYREKLFMKKQLQDEKRRRKLLKKMAASANGFSTNNNENIEEESSSGSVPVPMPDLALPTSFDSDYPTHRYRTLDTPNQWLVRAVLEPHGWDHDVGYEGINVEKLFVIKDKIPISFSSQITKDKRESNFQMELASCVKHGERKATSLGFDMQTVGKDLSYTIRSESRFPNFRNNNTAAGISATVIGNVLTGGIKLEDKLLINKWFKLVLSGGAMMSRDDIAYGGCLEATLRDTDYPIIGQKLMTLALSAMDWHGDLATSCNIQFQAPAGRNTNLIARVNLNNKGSGQISVRLHSSEQLQIVLIGILPALRHIFKDRITSFFQSTQ